MTGRPGPASTGRGHDISEAPGWDATRALTVYVALLTVIPSQLIFAPLGAAGAPARVFGMLLLLWWCADWVMRPTRLAGRPGGVRIVLWCFVAAHLLSYFAAMLRPIDGVELRSADRGLLTLAAWLGTMLVASDRLPTRDRLEVLLRRLVAAVGAVATLGILQFFTGEAWVDRVSIPGLSLNSELAGVMGRDGFVRPAGTAVHPIEFGVVLTMVLPLALHFAFCDRERSLMRRWWPPAVIALAVPLSISRSAVLSATVAVLFMLPTWRRARRRQAYALMVLLAAAVYVVVPGLLGAIKGLFLGISTDSSAASRTDSYAIAWEFIKRDPVFGRGAGTFLTDYRILDNQYLGSAIETGLIGLTVLLLLLLGGILTAKGVRRRTDDHRVRDLAQSIAAGIAASAVTLATYDGLGFPMGAGVLMLLVGCASALHRLQTAPHSAPVDLLRSLVERVETRPMLVEPAAALERDDNVYKAPHPLHDGGRRRRVQKYVGQHRGR